MTDYGPITVRLLSDDVPITVRLRSEYRPIMSDNMERYVLYRGKFEIKTDFSLQYPLVHTEFKDKIQYTMKFYKVNLWYWFNLSVVMILLYGIAQLI